MCNPMNIIFLSLSFWACCYYTFLSSLSRASSLSDNITASRALKDGETLVSPNEIYELGFFSPGTSKNRYLGIWFKNIRAKTYVWVANRENPINDSSGLLAISSDGTLELIHGSTNVVVWSAIPSAAAQSPATAKILDSGNLVLTGIYTNTYLWQSFDYPTDTLLAGMKLGWDLRTKFQRRLTSWKSADDPSPGKLSCGIELDPFPQFFMYKDSTKYFRGGPWNGLRFTGAPELETNSVFNFSFVANREEIYYAYELKTESVISTFVLNETTSTRDRYVWEEAERSWNLFASLPRDQCDGYGLCGPNGICRMSGTPVCQCLLGFEPKSPQSWNAADWSGGCVRREPLNCTERHEFVKLSGLKLPDTDDSWVDGSLNLGECEEMCSRNCSCTAYSSMDVRGRGGGCALWFDDLVDVRDFPVYGQDLYIRMPHSNRRKRSPVIIPIVGVSVALLVGGLLFVACYIFYRRRKAKNISGENEEIGQDCIPQREDMGLPLFDLATITRATGSFSEDKKLGQGGFGPVYKGTLIDGTHVAVKRLSKSSGQGPEEFKNEAKLIAKLQHRNLVRLLGCCIEGEETILVYEYMPKRSLDSYIFDEAKRLELNWRKRFDIICGIARGLLYLHQDSRLRIIHRDLKAGNVLLDDDMNPKISDFGIARTFGEGRDRDNTRRIVGTYGYMAPEYAIYGLFSVKSDVFSFGVLLLEIVSGKKNCGFDNPQNLQNLIGYTWKLWTEGNQTELIDRSIESTQHSEEEIERCVQIGLLCIQQNPEDRPSMSSVVLMLNGEGALPRPKQPGFLIDFIPSEAFSSPSESRFSVNDVTITTMEGR